MSGLDWALGLRWSTLNNLKVSCPSHTFEAFGPATGYWQKRDCPGDGIYVPGVVEKCAGCGEMRLKPDHPGMQTVEVEL